MSHPIRRPARIASAWILLCIAGTAQAAQLSLVSQSDDPTTPGAQGGRQPAMDASGEVIAYVSSSQLIDDEVHETTQTVPATRFWIGNPGTRQIYVQETRSAAQTLITDDVPLDGYAIGGDGDSYDPSVSPSGRYIAFASRAVNLADPGPYDGPVSDVFRHDRTTRTTDRMTDLQLHSNQLPDVAETGAVVFQTNADIASAGDANNIDDIYLTVVPKVYVRVSVPGVFPVIGSAGASRNAKISGDGRYVVFDSLASNLTLGDGNFARDVFLRNLTTNTTTRLSDAPGADQLGANSFDADISHDGRFVTFTSEATNLIAGFLTTGTQVFLLDRNTGVLTRIPLGPSVIGSLVPPSARLAPSGDYVSVETGASPGTRALHRYQRETGIVDFVTSLLTDPTISNDFTHAISDDGLSLTFDNRSAMPQAQPNLSTAEVYRTVLEPGRIAFENAELRIDESIGSARVAVQRTDGDDGAVRAWLSFERTGLATAAMPNWDYATYATTGDVLLRWADGDLGRREIVIPIVQDQRIEGDESFKLRLQYSVGGAPIGDIDAVEVVIVDDD